MINKQRMQNAVLQFLTLNQAQLSLTPSIADLTDEYRDIINQINEMHQVQIVSSLGYTKTKNELKQNLLNALMPIINAATAYAAINENLIFRNEIKFSRSQLYLFPQQKLVSVTLNIIASCRRMVAQLSPYGITPQILDDITPILNAYQKALPTPKLAIANRKTATERLGFLFQNAASLLSKIDAVMEITSSSQPILFADYKNLRIINDLKHRGKNINNQ